VVWVNTGNGLNEPGVYLQQFSSEGFPVGPNTKVDGTGDLPKVCIDEMGNALVFHIRNLFGDFVLSRYSESGDLLDRPAYRGLDIWKHHGISRSFLPTARSMGKHGSIIRPLT
jgi:hypothetical protein